MGFLDATDYKKIGEDMLNEMWRYEYEFKLAKNDENKRYELLMREYDREYRGKKKEILALVETLKHQALKILQMEKALIRKEFLTNDYAPDNDKTEKKIDELWNIYWRQFNNGDIEIFTDYFYKYREFELKELYADMKRLKELGYPYDIYEKY